MITPTAPSPHYPLISACADRDQAEGIHATALRGWPGRQALTPVAPRPHEPGRDARHTLRGCPARAGSAPCLCIAGDR